MTNPAHIARAQDQLHRSAVISDCGKYRYLLQRQVVPGDDWRCLFIMLNPSTADADKDDPTIRKCMTFVKSWGYNWLTVVNLFAYRATSPVDLLVAESPVGPVNSSEIINQAANSDLIVCAWGKHGQHMQRADRVRSVLEGKDLHYLQLNSDGSPRHPLYVRGDTFPTKWGSA